MTPRLTLTRRITLTVLSGLLGSVVLGLLFNAAYWRVVAAPGTPPADAPMFQASVLIAESAGDGARTAQILDLLKRHSPGHHLSVYTASGDLVASTLDAPAARRSPAPADWTRLSVEERGDRLQTLLPLVASSGDRFYAVHDAPDRRVPASVQWWFWLVCSIPVLWSSITALLLARSITRPLDRIVATSRAWANGDLSARVGLARGDELGFLASTLDEMAERIAALLRARTELLALVSHELRTPLARIRVALDLANASGVDSAGRLLPHVGTDLVELERLLGDTLTYSRLELVDKGGAGTPLNLEEVDPAPLLDEAAARFRHAWAGRTLLLELDAELPLLVADRPLLMRVVSNLLENAAKYSNSDQSIILSGRSAEGHLLIEVVDHGPGFEAADLPHVFEPFYRARTVRGHATTGGLGLGLTLCRRVVEAHGGTIEARDTPNGGATIRVRLPAAAHDRAFSPLRDPSPGPLPGARPDTSR